MYIPADFLWTDRPAILAFIRQHNFAAMTTGGVAGLHATHLPFVLEEGANEKLILHAHLSRANPQANVLATGAEVMVVFSGPHAYVSPHHYDRADSVPTWNYLAVHAYGQATIVMEEAEGYRSLERLMEAAEPGYEAHWAQVSNRYKEGLFRGIVPFKIEVTRLDAKSKASQNKNEAERRRIAEEFLSAGDTAAQELGRFMQTGLAPHLHE